MIKLNQKLQLLFSGDTIEKGYEGFPAVNGLLFLMKKGIYFNINDKDMIEVIFVYSGHDNIKQYKGDLPYSLKFFRYPNGC